MRDDSEDVRTCGLTERLPLACMVDLLDCKQQNVTEKQGHSLASTQRLAVYPSREHSVP